MAVAPLLLLPGAGILAVVEPYDADEGDDDQLSVELLLLLLLLPVQDDDDVDGEYDAGGGILALGDDILARYPPSPIPLVAPVLPGDHFDIE